MERKAPEALCDACGEIVGADQCEQACGWTICRECRTASGQVDHAASGFDYTLDLPPFWQAFGDVRGKN